MGTSLAEVEARVATVAEWIIELKTRSEILRAASDMGWGLSTRQIETYIKRARELTQKQFEEELSSQRSKIFKRLSRLGKKAEQKDDISVARQVEMDKAKILGLGAEKIDLTIKDDRKLSEEDAQVLLEEALEDD